MTRSRISLTACVGAAVLLPHGLGGRGGEPGRSTRSR